MQEIISIAQYVKHMMDIHIYKFGYYKNICYIVINKFCENMTSNEQSVK